MYRSNRGRSFSRYKKSRKSIKALNTFPLEVGNIKVLEPTFSAKYNRIVYPVHRGSRLFKTFFTIQNLAIFMLRQEEKYKDRMKVDSKLNAKLKREAAKAERERVKKEKEKAKKARERAKAASANARRKKNPGIYTEHDERLMDFLTNPFDDIFDEPYDVVPKRRRR